MLAENQDVQMKNVKNFRIFQYTAQVRSKKGKTILKKMQYIEENQIRLSLLDELMQNSGAGK